MKKIICLVLCVLCVVSMSACSLPWESSESATVDITIPLEMLEMGGETFDYQLTEENKEKGFISIKKNEDGSATYTIKKSDYEVLKKELKEATKTTLNELVSDGTFSSVKRISFNGDFSEITLTVDKSKFENSFDSMAIMSCGLSSLLYQMYDVDAKQECVIKVEDASTGEVFRTETYPQ